MSRGLGRVERLLLHAVYAHPRVAPNGRRFIWPSDFAETGSEYSSLQRAARSVLRKGFVTGASNDLEPLSECPVVSVQKCSETQLCEHIKAVHVRRAEKDAVLERRRKQAWLEYLRTKRGGGEPA